MTYIHKSTSIKYNDIIEPNQHSNTQLGHTDNSKLAKPKNPYSSKSILFSTIQSILKLNSTHSFHYQADSPLSTTETTLTVKPHKFPTQKIPPLNRLLLKFRLLALNRLLLKNTNFYSKNSQLPKTMSISLGCVSTHSNH